MGKLYDAMCKFEDNTINKNSVKKDTIPAKKPVKDLNSSAKETQKDLKKGLPPKENNAKLNPAKANRDCIINTSIEKSTSNEIIEKPKAIETQYIVLNQSQIKDAESDNISKSENLVDKEIISQELLKYRNEFSRYKFKEIEKKEKFLFKLFKRNKYLVHKKPNSIFSETFKIIRNNILIKAKEKKINTILITSTSSTDGKSLIAANLAVSIARNFDKYLLLVDTDFRRPTLHNYFNLERKVGLSDYLINNKLSFEEIVRKTDFPKLSMIPVGAFYENSSEIISSEIMKLFVKDVKYRYEDRMVIFDAPPINISDAVAISDMVDGVILIVKAGKTDKRIFENAIEKIGKNKLIGVIVNYGRINMKEYYPYY